MNTSTNNNSQSASEQNGSHKCFMMRDMEDIYDEYSRRIWTLTMVDTEKNNLITTALHFCILYNKISIEKYWISLWGGRYGVVSSFRSVTNLIWNHFAHFRSTSGYRGIKNWIWHFGLSVLTRKLIVKLLLICTCDVLNFQTNLILHK